MTNPFFNQVANLFIIRREQPTVGAIERAAQMMAELLSQRGLNPDEHSHEEGIIWLLPTSVGTVIVRLIRVEAENEDEDTDQNVGKDDNQEVHEPPQDFIEVTVRVIRLPSTQLLALYRFLLEQNSLLFNSSLAIEEDSVILRSARSLRGMDEQELNDMIIFVAMTSARIRPVLLEQFAIGAVPV